jgi:hypothetical protein
MIFHESYGYLPKSTLRLIKKHNVSPMDYQFLSEFYGDDFDTINADIVNFSRDGSFRLFEWERAG